LDIDLPQSEKKTLYRFLALYTFFTLIILGLTTYLYFTLQKELVVKERVIKLNDYANEFITQLKELKTEPQNEQNYPYSDNFETSLYDKRFNLIDSTLEEPKAQLDEISYTEDTIVRYLKNPEEYYRNAQYVIVQAKADTSWLNSIIQKIIIYGTLFFIFMLIVGYFLLNLFLKPMKDAMYLLDQFIKDTTHELNTPISAIMTNIELIDKESIKDKFLLKAINRIDIGVKTISNIYDDLTYLILKHKIISNDQDILLKEIITQRIEYFAILANIKHINITTALDAHTTLHIDPVKLSKLIDNILSNAIKYNKINGTIHITLRNNSLCIKDSGKGIKKENLALLFDRYARFDKSVGGFGIGLNIVKMICEEYKLNISVDSELEKGTEVTISW
jgi:two-component system OmpR family sensor kinase